MMNRRHFLGAASAGLAMLHVQALTGCATSTQQGTGAVGVGICDWNIGRYPDPELIPLASEAHIEGIQVSVGSGPDNILLRDPQVRSRYLELGRQYGMTFHSVAIGILNSVPLATEPQSAVFVIDAIEVAAALGSTNILLAFFGRGDLRMRGGEGNFLVEQEEGDFKSYALNEASVDSVVNTLRQVVPRARDAGVLIGLENTITARQNLQIIERIESDMVKVYYDVGNSWGNGYDVPGEIRMLGNDMICEVHLKDWNTSMLGSEGAMVDMSACASALVDIGFDKWLVLETSGRRDRFVEDTQANVEFVKSTFQMA